MAVVKAGPHRYGGVPNPEARRINRHITAIGRRTESEGRSPGDQRGRPVCIARNRSSRARQRIALKRQRWRTRPVTEGSSPCVVSVAARHVRSRATHRKGSFWRATGQRKTNSAGFEVACHRTGITRTTGQVSASITRSSVGLFGVDSSQVRDVLQKELLGKSQDDAYTGDGCTLTKWCRGLSSGHRYQGRQRAEGQARIRWRVHAVVQILHADCDRAIPLCRSLDRRLIWHGWTNNPG